MEYHKIQTVFNRDPGTKYKTLLEGQFARPEFEYLEDLCWIWTEKVDGTNIRIFWEAEQVRFGGKTDNAQIPVFLYDKLNALFNSEQMGKVFDVDCATLYGEGFGAKIQKGGGDYNPDGVDFVLFDVRVGDAWLARESVEDIADNLRIGRVPIIGRGSLGEMVEKVRAGFESAWGDFTAEGIVARPEVELRNRMGGRVITKIKHKDFG